MKRLLVTGGCGFIGSNFINHYFKNVEYLVNLDAMYYCASEDNVNIEIRESDNYKLVKGNLCSADLVNHILKQYRITHIIHFAAQSHVQNSFDDSLSFTKDNILGTHTLLDCCHKYRNIEKFIHVSTDEVYGESMLKDDEQHKTEECVLCPSNPYAATKAGAELIAQSYYHSFKMPIVITRCNNVYGPNQYPEKLVPRFIELLKNDKKVTIQGDGSNIRAFLHVDDTVKAFSCILDRGKIGEIYNIGCDERMEYSVLEIAKILIKLIKHTDKYEEWIEYIEDIEDRPFNDKRYYISNQKVKDLGWEIKIKFEDGIQKLIYHEFYYKPILNNLTCINTNENIKVYEVFIFCSGKCGGSTLYNTFLKNEYNSLQTHSNWFWMNDLKMKGSVFDVIERSRIHYKNIYIIDSYREPIGRKISSFFQILDVFKIYFKNNNHINFDIYNTFYSELVDIFLKYYLEQGEEYESIDEVCCYYNVPRIKEFDFEKGYVKIEHNNITIIKLLFKDIQIWDKYLSKIFNKNITIKSENLSENKPYKTIYNNFVSKFRIEKNKLVKMLSTNNSFKIFNTIEEQEKIIDKWSL